MLQHLNSSHKGAALWCPLTDDIKTSLLVRIHYNEGSVQQGFIWEHEERFAFLSQGRVQPGRLSEDTDLAVHQHRAPGTELSTSVMVLGDQSL